MTNQRYPVRLTGGQLRVLHETLAVVLNDPTWAEATGMTQREWAMLARASTSITDTWRGAAQADSTPALHHHGEQQ